MHLESNRLRLKEFRLDWFIGSFPYIPGSNFSLSLHIISLKKLFTNIKIID